MIYAVQPVVFMLENLPMKIFHAIAGYLPEQEPHTEKIHRVFGKAAGKIFTISC